MKAQCERCKEIVPLEFAVEAGGIRVVCPACKEAYVVRATSESASSSTTTSSTGEITCPKCGAGQKAAEACRRCGLIFANWDPEKAGALEVGEAKEAAALWDRCLEEWHDAARHDAFIEQCRRSGVLGLAAARYRQNAGKDGAAERLKQIRALAEQSLVPVPRAPFPAPKRNLWAGIVLIMVLLLGGYAFLQLFSP